MKIVQNIIRNLGRPVTLALAGLALCAATTQAASIEMWVYAKNTSWAILVPGSNTGGRVVYSREYGCNITDRAQRGETVDAWLAPTTAAERSNPVIKRCWLSSTAGTKELGCYQPKLSTWINDFKVPTSVFWDDNYINVTTASGTFKVRIPVGGRP